MKRPDPVAYAKDGVRVAMRKMKEASISSIYVLDRDSHVKGLLTIDDAVELMKSEDHDLNRVLVRDFTTVSPDTSIENLLPLVIAAKYPVVVADEENKMLGIIMKVSVLSGIFGEEINHD
jgi:glycine betaine/proline transport system ATP-binding protein